MTNAIPEQVNQTSDKTLNRSREIPLTVTTAQSGSRVRRFVSSDNYEHKFRHWPAEQTKSVVIALHGIQSHSGWYKNSSSNLSCHGCDVYFADRRGSGLNGFQRGHSPDASRLLNDVRQLVQMARTEHPTAEITLLGISWGGKIAAAYAAAHPQEIDRLALVTPGLKPQIGPSRRQSLLLKLAMRLDWKQRHIRNPLNDSTLFTDQDSWQFFIDNDPLKLEWITTGLVHSGYQLDHAVTESTKIRCPTLLCLAGQDQIIDNAATKKLVSAWPTEMLSIRNFPHARHTLEFSASHDEFVENLTMFCLGLT